MIICFCHGINDRALDNVIDGGARSVREVADACGAGTDCGQCCRDVRDRLKARRITIDQQVETSPLSK